jgi:hypothetical protein
LAGQLHLPHVVHRFVPHLVILVLNLVINRYVTVIVNVLAPVVVGSVLRIHASSEVTLQVLLRHLHIVSSGGLPALELVVLGFLLVVDLAHLEVSQKLLVLVDMGAIILTIVDALLAHHNRRH